MKQEKRRLRPWRLLWMTVLLVMALGATALAAEVGETKTENGFTAAILEIQDGLYKQPFGVIIDYTGTDENVVLPEWVGDICIERIGKGAFRNCTTMKTLTIESYVGMMAEAFEGCTALTDVYVNGNWYADGSYTDGEGELQHCPFIGLHGVKIHNGPNVDEETIKKMRVFHMPSICDCDLKFYYTDDGGAEQRVPAYDYYGNEAVPMTIGGNQLTLSCKDIDGRYVGAGVFIPDEAGLYNIDVKGAECWCPGVCGSLANLKADDELLICTYAEGTQVEVTITKISQDSDKPNIDFVNQGQCVVEGQGTSLDLPCQVAGQGEDAYVLDPKELLDSWEGEIHAEIISGKENGYLVEDAGNNQIKFYGKQAGEVVVRVWMDFDGSILSGSVRLVSYHVDEDGNIVVEILNEGEESELQVDKNLMSALKNVDGMSVSAEQADLKMDGTVTDKVIKSIQTQDDITTLEISKTQGDGAAETLSLRLSDASGQNLLPEKTAESNGTVTVSMPYEKQDDVVKVYYKSGDTLEEVESTYDEAQGRVVFETKHLSDFLVTSEPAVADDPAPAPGPEPGATTEASFLDVQDPGQYYYDAVLWAVKNNITNGVGGGMFAPDNTCKREQVVTFLWRAMGSPEPTSTYCPFTDVAQGNYYYKAVLWAAENDITKGKTAEKFAPKDTITRAEFVTFLWRAQGKPGCSTSNPFWDVPSGSYYYDAVLWAAENDITKGKTAEKFAPKDPCTRGQVVTFLYRDMG